MRGCTPEFRLVCRQCASEALDDLGVIPAAGIFAGQLLEPPWAGGSLYRCRRCHLAFRHPIRSEKEYERLYSQASEQVWVSSEPRLDQRLVVGQIESDYAAGSVLDVGCYDGALLATLSPRFSKYGIEVSAAAGKVAQLKGIEILGTKIRDIPSIAEKFDVVCAIDVIEHVANPLGLLAMLSNLLLPNGTLFISSGNADTPAWRAAGGLFWYCSFPEHISFISHPWACAAAAATGLEVVAVRQFAYSEIDFRSRVRLRRQFNRKIAWAKYLTWIRTWLPVLPASSSQPKSRGRPGIFEDHILISFKNALAKPRTQVSHHPLSHP